MKKEYIRPVMTVNEIEPCTILAGSGGDELNQDFDFGGGDRNTGSEEEEAG